MNYPAFANNELQFIPAACIFMQPHRHPFSTEAVTWLPIFSPQQRMTILS
jgi:hypothetical protein